MIRRFLPLFILLTLVTLIGLVAVEPGYAYSFNPSVCASYNPEQGSPTQECVAMMEAFPDPIVIETPIDFHTLNQYSYWRIGPHVVNLYDAPNGNVISQMPEGFNFVVAVDTSLDDWIQIQGGQWVQADDVEYQEASHFAGVVLMNGLDYPFAWVMDLLFTSEYPGGPQSVENGRLFQRYDRANIFAQAEDENGWLWYMVGPDQWIEQRVLAIAHRTEKPEDVGGRWVAVDLYEQTLVAYEDDVPVFATLISSGLPHWETNEGIFEIWARLPADPMSGATGAPDAYALQSVPWTMYFDNDISLHGTYWHDGFGYRHSHGCVNLSISDANYIFQWTAEAKSNEDDELVSYVYVYSSGEYRLPG
jgi:hypothetical protein